jgi:enoyl-[acyl-carrier-protein] reductase (NADH)
MSIKSRVNKIEEKLSLNQGRVPQEDCVQLVYSGDPEKEEKIAEIEKRIFEKHGTIEGLVIITSYTPLPDPLPEDYKAV